MRLKSGWGVPAVLLMQVLCAGAAHGAVHVWEKQEVTLTAARDFGNPYTEVTVWVDLTGPHFHKRVYGFWDGGRTFNVRVVATEPGEWRWTSGSEPADAGLDGKHGSFTAIAWSDAELNDNPLRRGFLRASKNGHALETADGTPFLVVGDTWWAAGTNRFKWYDDDRERAMGPEAGFKDYVRFRKAQGYNWINMIAAFSQLGDGWAAVACDDAGWDDGALSVAGVRHGQREEHGQRRRAAVCVSRQGAGIRADVPGCEPDQSGVLRRHRPQDRLSEPAGFCCVHRGVAARCEPGVEEVLWLAGFLCAVHRVRVGKGAGEQRGAQSDPSGHHQRDGGAEGLRRRHR